MSHLYNIDNDCFDDNRKYVDPSTMIENDKKIYAYITFVPTDIYISSALVLGHSLKSSGTLADLIVMISPLVSKNIEKTLHMYYDKVIRLSIDHDKNVVRFYALNFVEYNKIIIIDVDSIIMKYPDHLFTLDTPACCFYIDNQLVVYKNGEYVFPNEINRKWYEKYCKYYNHGNLVTIEMIYAKGFQIMTGLLVLTPSSEKFDQIIKHFKKKSIVSENDIRYYLINMFSDKWIGINPNFHGRLGESYWNTIYGIKYDIMNPFSITNTYNIPQLVKNPSFVQWHTYYYQILEKHPDFYDLMILNNANEINSYFHSSIKANNYMMRIKNESNIDNIKKLYRIHDDHIVNSEYFYTENNTEYIYHKIKPLWIDIDDYDYMEPIIRLADYYGEKSYYNKLVDLYGNEFHKKKRLDEQMLINSIDVADRDLIMTEYVKCRKNMKLLFLLSPIVQRIEMDDIMELVDKHCVVYYIKTIELNKNGMTNLIFWMNNDMTFSGRHDYINHKFKNHIFDQNNTTIIFFEPADKYNDNILINEIKKMSKIDDDTLIYITKNFFQTIQLSQMILNDNTLKMLEYQEIDNIISPYTENTNLKIQTIKKFCYDNLSLLEFGRILLHGDIVLYSYGYKNFENINITFESVGNDESQSEKELNLLMKSYFNHDKTKFKFANIKKNQNWEIMIENSDTDGTLEIISDPSCYYYYQGFKILLMKYEIMRKIYNDKINDHADFMAMSLIYPELVSQYVKYDKNQLTYKINKKNQKFNDEYIKKLIKYINKKYSKSNIAKFHDMQ